jgi:hypothetical protein
MDSILRCSLRFSFMPLGQLGKVILSENCCTFSAVSIESHSLRVARSEKKSRSAVADAV